MLSVGAVVVEEEVLGQAIGERLLGDLVAQSSYSGIGYVSASNIGSLALVASDQVPHVLAWFDLLFDLGAGASHAQPSVTSGDSDGIRRDRVAPAAKRCPRIGACADSSRVPAAPRFHPPTLR